MRGLGESRLDRGRVAIAHRGHDIVGRFRPYRGRAGLGRLQRIDHRRQHLVIDDDRFRCGLRGNPRSRYHGRDGLAGKAQRSHGPAADAAAPSSACRPAA